MAVPNNTAADIAKRRGFITPLLLGVMLGPSVRGLWIFRIENDRTMTRTAAFNLSSNVLPECNAGHSHAVGEVARLAREDVLQAGSQRDN